MSQETVRAIVGAGLIGLALVVAGFLVPPEKNPMSPRAANAQLTISGEKILGSACTSQISQIRFAGEPNELTAPPALVGMAPKGTVYVCWTKYRIKDSDTHGDYYGALAESYWTLKSGRTDGKAVTSQSIKSNTGAKGNVCGATGGFSSSISCLVNFTVPISVGFTGADIPVKVYKGFKVRRPTYAATGAAWTTQNAGALRVNRTMFAEKVAEGARPKFRYSFAIPQYTKTWDEAAGHWEWTAHLVYQNFTA